MTTRTVIIALACSLSWAGNSWAQLNDDREFVKSLAQFKVGEFYNSAVGVTRKGLAIRCLVSENDWNWATKKIRLLLVGGLDGKRQSVEAVLHALKQFTGDSQLQREFALSAVPCANPEGVIWAKGKANASGGVPSRGYPPRGAAYSDPTNPEAVYLWRWIGMHAPDLVVDVRHGAKQRWYATAPLDEFFSEKLASPPADSLVRQLSQSAPCETGAVPAIQVQTPTEFLTKLLTTLRQSRFSGPSAARREIQRRVKRTPLETARQLSEHYGRDLKQVVYIPALALIGRIRLGEITGDSQHLQEVMRIASPYAGGEKTSSLKSGSALSGHLLFCELAAATSGQQRQRYVQLARAAADMAFDQKGRPKPSMPFHLEMSDSVFMGGPILARVGQLTGDERYYDACAKHLAFMQGIGLRADGLYRHSPLDETAWGRGNGFPALGVAMCLTFLPEDHPRRSAVLKSFRNHIEALAKHQDPTGMWRQVIDREESYRELSATCMITFAMACGVRRGWLDRRRFQPIIDKAWTAIKTRTPANGRLVDVCAGTGKQINLRAYLDRTAILGPDPRGGAMALLAATELIKTR